MQPITVRLMRVEDTDAILNLELENRAWFEQWVPPRPDEYFARAPLDKINKALVAEATTDTAYMHLILNAEDQVIGRINLTDIHRESISTAELGYRIAHDMTGRGIATQAILIIERVAREVYNLDRLRASCLETNPASAAVLYNRGFCENNEIRTEFIWKGQTTTMLHFQKQLG